MRCRLAEEEIWREYEFGSRYSGCGWQASTIVSLHSGFPLAVYNATDTSGTGSRGPVRTAGLSRSSDERELLIERRIPGIRMDESRWVFRTGNWDLWQLSRAGS